MSTEETTQNKPASTDGHEDAAVDQGAANDEPEENNDGMSTTRKYILFGILVVVLIVGGIYGWKWLQFSRHHASTDNAQIDGHISPVIPRVEGYVKHIYVDDNQKVAKGQLLVTIDKDKFNIRVKKAKARLAAAKASREEAKAGLATAKVEENRAEVSLNHAKTEKDRQQRLLNDQSTTQQTYDNASFKYKSAKAQRSVAAQNVQAARVKLESVKANIEEAKSNLDDAKLDLSYTKLHAPISGHISKKNIEVGQLISPGNPVMAISKDDSVWVVANFKEGQIKQIKVGQPVDIHVDAFPHTKFKGRVQSLAGATGSKFALLPPDNASGNFVKVEQRIPVKIVFTSKIKPDKQPKPGMNVEPTVRLSN